MAWPTLGQKANAVFLSLWGIQAVLAPAALPGQTFPITGIIKDAPIEEEFLPGATPGVEVVRLWVNYTSLPQQPVRGDVISIDGVSYDVADVKVDIEGGAVLKLRGNGGA